MRLKRAKGKIWPSWNTLRRPVMNSSFVPILAAFGVKLEHSSSPSDELFVLRLFPSLNSSILSLSFTMY